MNSGLNGLPSHRSMVNDLVAESLNFRRDNSPIPAIFASYTNVLKPVIDVVYNGSDTFSLFQTGCLGFPVANAGGNFPGVGTCSIGGGGFGGGFGSLRSGMNTSGDTPQFLSNGTIVAAMDTNSTRASTAFALPISSPDVSWARTAANVWKACTGGTTLGGWVQWGGQARVTSQFDKVTDTTLANIPGLSVTVAAGRTYTFRVYLHVSPDTVGGQKYAIAGTCTATSVIYQINTINNTTNASIINSRQTALGGSAGVAGGTADYTEIVGTITVNAGGTLTVQFAQNAASGTSSVLVGSFMEVNDIP